MPWDVRPHPEALTEINDLSPTEQAAVMHAMEKLASMGPALPFPHDSAVLGANDLRELRPQRGRSRLRVFYRKVGDLYVVGAIGPEANADRKGFDLAVEAAERRIDEVEY